MSEMINIIVTGKGSFPMEGIPKPGTKKAIPVERFSEKWMKPADAAASKAVKVYLNEKAAAPKRPTRPSKELEELGVVASAAASAAVTEVMEGLMERMAPSTNPAPAQDQGGSGGKPDDKQGQGAAAKGKQSS